MAECTRCGDEIDMPYTCNYCGLNHCSRHRLPEKHDCLNADRVRTLGPELRRERRDADSISAGNRTVSRLSAPIRFARGGVETLASLIRRFATVLAVAVIVAALAAVTMFVLL